ncbi:MAG: tRNA uridine-5-carboxymethylaminomethyl(34) synthesis GTPase MnmE [Desulfobulbaceae bacterium]|nr:tRNA uridine-5-carboxymethylaminomethyl(34) synthesis GTPase MnmE [Desulfobulbaceae bacterium]
MINSPPTSETVSEEKTIAAIATPPGAGGIGIIRMSGSLSLSVLKDLFKPRRQLSGFVSHHMYYGWVVNPHTRVPVDEVLAVYMKAPSTYTREDVVEIHCHGSYLVLQEILTLLLEKGVQLAEPGEFTKRAFLNGRIDLTQAEAVSELLQARTTEGAHLAMAHLQGRLASAIGRIRDNLLNLRAIIEVAIDFPEEDVDIMQPQEMEKRVEDEMIAPLRQLIATSDQGKIYREGISVVILGRPNVGKSSLLNALLKEERAIVTSLPGTTRDTIEEYLDIKGVPVRIIDTAGIREGAENIEEIGIERARRKLEGADLVLLLVDGSAPVDEEDRKLLDAVDNKSVLLVVNKIDLVEDFDVRNYNRTFPGLPVVPISAKTYEGLPGLEQGIFDIVTRGSGWDPGHRCVPNVRQRAALVRTLEAIDQMRQGLDAGLPPDLLAIDLQDGLDHLGEIVGETTTEDILAEIFAQFCIGK